MFLEGTMDFIIIIIIILLAQGKSLLLTGWHSEPVLDVVRIKTFVCLEQNTK